MRASALGFASGPLYSQLAVLSPNVSSGRAKLPCPHAVKSIRLDDRSGGSPHTILHQHPLQPIREEALNGQPVPQLRGV